MKIGMTFKTPDVLSDALDTYKRSLREDEGIRKDSDEWYDKLDKVEQLLRKFIEYGEYISVEFDTETGTCTVDSI